MFSWLNEMMRMYVRQTAVCDEGQQIMDIWIIWKWDGGWDYFNPPIWTGHHTGLFGHVCSVSGLISDCTGCWVCVCFCVTSGWSGSLLRDGFWPVWKRSRNNKRFPLWFFQRSVNLWATVWPDEERDDVLLLQQFVVSSRTQRSVLVGSGPRVLGERVSGDGAGQQDVLTCGGAHRFGFCDEPGLNAVLRLCQNEWARHSDQQDSD